MSDCQTKQVLKLNDLKAILKLCFAYLSFLKVIFQVTGENVFSLAVALISLYSPESLQCITLHLITAQVWKQLVLIMGIIYHSTCVVMLLRITFAVLLILHLPYTLYLHLILKKYAWKINIQETFHNRVAFRYLQVLDALAWFVVYIQFFEHLLTSPFKCSPSWPIRCLPLHLVNI